MLDEPRTKDDYSPRQVEAAERVIVDVMQVLASFKDCIVLVGGWVPVLTIENPAVPHSKSTDVDLALDVDKLADGRYAEMLDLLFNTRRYEHGERDFQLVTKVELEDGQDPVVVAVEFLAPKDVKTKKNRPKFTENFRVLKADGCGAAFHSPLTKRFDGRMIGGAKNTVSLQVASVPDFLVMKAHALNGRDKPKDAYDICFCLDHYAGGMEDLATAWRVRLQQNDSDTARAVEILREKFTEIESYGPQQVVEFEIPHEEEVRAQVARRALELVRQFLELVESEGKS